MTQMHKEASNVALKVLEAIRVTNPELIADNMPPGWGMKKLRTALNGRNLCVDGHETADSESNWVGDGKYPPFSVFDIDSQENLLPYYPTRSQAEGAMKRMLEVTNLDAVVGGYAVKARLDEDDHLTLFVSHSDGSPVLFIDEDIAAADSEFAVRLTTQEIEDQQPNAETPRE